MFTYDGEGAVLASLNTWYLFMEAKCILDKLAQLRQQIYNQAGNQNAKCDNLLLLCVCVCVFVCVCVCVCVFIKLHITAQSGPVILVILCHSH